MIKTKKVLFVTAVAALLTFFTSCKCPCGCGCSFGCSCGGGDCGCGCGDVATVDFRIKDSTGTARSVSYAGRAASGEIAECTEVSEASGLTQDEIKALFEFSDDAGGIKVTFKRPEALEKGWKSEYFRMIYIDGQGVQSTTMEFASEKRFNDEEGKNLLEEYSWVYPLVNAGHTYKFKLTGTFGHYYDDNGNWINGDHDQVRFTMSYNITPNHDGIGMVDDVPSDFKSSTEGYISFDKGLVTLNDVIPPQSDYSVKKVVNVFGTMNENYYDWSDMSQFVDKYKVAMDTGNSTEVYIVDAPVVSWCTAADGERLYKDYVVVSFFYEYSIKNYPDLIFYTPEIYSKAYHPNFFYTPYDERMVSETTMEGNTVTFSGDGKFDGFYESDIDVSFDDGIYTPALFVYGTKVYILSVEDGVYTAKKSMKVSDFLLDGGNFSSKNATVKSTLGEAKIAKSSLKEISFTGSF